MVAMHGAGLARALPVLVSAAAVDSVNPCTFYIYAAMLLAVSIRSRDPGAVRMVAAAFVAAVYVGYLAVGLAAAAASLAAPPWLLGLAAVLYGFWVFFNALLHRPAGRPGGRLARRALLAATPLAAAGLGLLASFTLLPCSSGPLLAFLAYARMQGLGTMEMLVALLIYNAVFVAPLALLGAVAAAAAGVARLQRVLARYSRLVEALAGLLLVGVGLWVLAGPG